MESEKCGAGVPARESELPSKSKSLTADDNFKSFYRRCLPHLRNEDAIYFVTWRLHNIHLELTEIERDIVSSALEHFHEQRYRLIACVVMNDHVHVVFQILAAFQLHNVIQGWKSFSANRIYRLKTKDAPIWQDEYFDRIIRNERDLAEKVDYVRNNPVKRWPELIEYRWVFDNSKEYFLGH